MTYLTTRQMFFMLSFTMDVKEQEKLDHYLKFLEESGIGDFLKSNKPNDAQKGGRPSFNRYDLFVTILFGFTLTSGSLREIESSYKQELRFIYLMKQESPSYVVLGNYINEFIVPY